MSSKAFLADQANERELTILRKQKQYIAQQLSATKEKLAVLESGVQEVEESKRKYQDALLCVSRLWKQFNSDVKRVCARNRTGPSTTAPDPAQAPDAAEAADADAQPEKVEGEESHQSLAWDSFDPVLARFLQADAAVTNKVLKRQTLDYLKDLSSVEEVMQARAAMSLEALGSLLDAIHARSKAAAEQQDALSALSADAAAQQANQQLQADLAELQEQLDEAVALQRSTEALLEQKEDRLAQAQQDIKQLRDEIADKEFELSSVERKYRQLQQQQQEQQEQAAPAAAAAAGAGPMAAAVAAAAAAAGDNQVAAVVEELQAQVQQLKEQLEDRTAEKDEQVEAVARLQRELEELRSRQGDETWVADSLMYQLAQQQLAEAQAQLEARSKQLAALQHDKDELLRHFEAKNAATETERMLRGQINMLTQQVHELNAKQVELLGQKQTQQVAHQQEIALYGSLKTATEMQALLAALQKEVDTSTGHARKAAEASGAAAAARQEAVALRAQLTAAQTNIQLLQSRLQAKASELAGLSGREDELRERLNDLSAFVEVLTTDDVRDVVEVRHCEASLKAQLAEAQAKLKGDRLQQQLSAALATEADLRKQLESTAVQAAELQGEVQGLQQQVSALEGQVQDKQRESEAFANEINDALAAYEQQRTQNTTLLHELSERDKAVQALRAEKLAVQQQLEGTGEQLAAVHVRVSSLEAELKGVRSIHEGLEKDFTRISSDLAAVREQLLAANSALDSATTELKATQDSRAALQVLYDQEKVGHESRKKAAEQAADELRQEAAKRQRLQDLNEQYEARLARLSSNAQKSEEQEELERENTAMRKMLTCSVCDQRQKNRVIVRCGHMFCSECLDQSLAKRNRKCPSCGHPYNGKPDITNFFFT